jgi:fucose permease
MAGFNALIPAAVTGAFVFGLAPVLLAALRAPLAARLAMDQDRAGGFVTALSWTLVPLLLLAGLLSDGWGGQVVVVLGSGVLAVGLAVLAGSQSAGQAGTGILLTGAGLAGLGVGSTVLMVPAFAPSQPAAATNLGTIFFTLGALLAPGLGDKLNRRWGLRRGLLAVALVALLPGLAAAFALLESIPTGSGPVGEVFASPLLWLAAAGLFCYVPLETTVANLSGRVLAESGHALGLTAVLTAGFWVSFLACRLGTGLFLSQGILLVANPEPWITLLLAVFTAILLGNVIGMVDARGAGLGLVAAGASMGPLLPTLLGKAVRLFPQAPGSACGAVLAAGTAGGLILSPLIARYARRVSARDALRVPLALALLLGVACLFLAFLER